MMCPPLIAGALIDVVLWLRSLGLAKYEAAFRENEIDETVIPSLTHETLKELGVTAVGHRLKLLDAIAALRSGVSGKTPSVNATTASSTPSAPPEDRAERAKSPSCSQTWSAQRPCRRAWTLKTCARSFPPTRNALQRPC